MYAKRRKSIGSKRIDITSECRNAIVKAFGEFPEEIYEYGEKKVESKIFDNEDFGYYKIVVESPKVDENGEEILKKNKPVADSKKRDIENVPTLRFLKMLQMNAIWNKWMHLRNFLKIKIFMTL